MSRNCSGTVVAIRYCYRAELNNGDINSGRVLNIFDLLSVTTLDTSDILTVNERFTVTSAVTEGDCMQLGPDVMGSRAPHGCCTTTTLDSSQQFDIPPSSYTFGIQVLSGRPLVIPYSFTAAATEFNVDQCHNGDGLSLSDCSLFLLRFIIGNQV